VTDKRLLQEQQVFVGAANFARLAGSAEFWTSLKNSAIWTAGSVIGQLVVGVFAALLLFFHPRFQGFFRTALIVPWMMPIIVIAIIWRWLFNDLYGVLPFVIATVGLTETAPSIFSTTTGSMVAVIAIDIWRAYPLMMLSTIAGLQTIPREHFEVAEVEGAKWFHLFRYLILPSIAGIVGIMVVLRTIWTFNDFARVYLLTGGGPGIGTQTVPIFAYKVSWFSRDIGLGAAISVLMLLILLVLSTFYIRSMRLERGSQ
jgi:multiple sugar transport system permease protein